MASGRFPRWAVVRPILGIVLSLALVAFVVARATGLVGDASADGSATAEVTDLTVGTPTALPSLTPRPSESPSATATDRDQERRDPKPDRRRDRDRDHDRGTDDGASWADGSVRDDELLSRVEELLRADDDEVAVPARFRVSTLNVLGAGHTGPRGSKPGYASGTTRIGWIAQLLRQLDVDVVGL